MSELNTISIKYAIHEFNTNAFSTFLLWKICLYIYTCTYSHRYTIRDQVLDDGMVSELGISHTYRQDTGMYICHAGNAFGQVSYLLSVFYTYTRSHKHSHKLCPKHCWIQIKLLYCVQFCCDPLHSGMAYHCSWQKIKLLLILIVMKFYRMDSDNNFSSFQFIKLSYSYGEIIDFNNWLQDKININNVIIVFG